MCVAVDFMVRILYNKLETSGARRRIGRDAQVEEITQRLDALALLCRKYGLPDDGLLRDAEELRGYHARAAILGGFNAGKSSLLNALAGAYVTRVSLCDETSAPLELFFGTRGVQIVRDESVTRSDPSALRAGGREMEEALMARAALPLPALRELEGVSLLDTPPLAGARAADNPLLAQLVRGADAYILVAGADAPVVTESVSAVLSGLPLSEKPVLAVLTKCDQFSPGDARAIAAYLQESLREQLGLPKLTVCRVSCGEDPDVAPVRDFLRQLQVRSAALARGEAERRLARGAEPLTRYLRERVESSRLLAPELERKADALHEKLERLHGAVDALNDRTRALAMDAAEQAAADCREKLQPLTAPLAYLSLTGQNAAVYADGALRSLLRGEARSRLAPVLNAYEKNLRRLSSLYAPDMPADGALDAEAFAEAAFPGTAEALDIAGSDERDILAALLELVRECLGSAAHAALEAGRERLAAPLYEQLRSLGKALDDARSEQLSASERHQRTLDELRADLERAAQLADARKEGTEDGV